MGLVEALHFCTLSHIVNHWQDVTTTEQLNQVIHKALLQLKLNGWTTLTVETLDSTNEHVSIHVPIRISISVFINNYHHKITLRQT